MVHRLAHFRVSSAVQHWASRVQVCIVQFLTVVVLGGGVRAVVLGRVLSAVLLGVILRDVVLGVVMKAVVLGKY